MIFLVVYNAVGRYSDHQVYLLLCAAGGWLLLFLLLSCFFWYFLGFVSLLFLVSNLAKSKKSDLSYLYLVFF